jgi:hypothetical protein
MAEQTEGSLEDLLALLVTEAMESPPEYEVVVADWGYSSAAPCTRQAVRASFGAGVELWEASRLWIDYNLISAAAGDLELRALFLEFEQGSPVETAEFGSVVFGARMECGNHEPRHVTDSLAERTEQSKLPTPGCTDWSASGAVLGEFGVVTAPMHDAEAPDIENGLAGAQDVVESIVAVVVEGTLDGLAEPDGELGASEVAGRFTWTLESGGLVVIDPDEADGVRIESVGVDAGMDSDACEQLLELGADVALVLETGRWSGDERPSPTEHRSDRLVFTELVLVVHVIDLATNTCLGRLAGSHEETLLVAEDDGWDGIAFHAVAEIIDALAEEIVDALAEPDAPPVL